jgi:hypothetical protein
MVSTLEIADDDGDWHKLCKYVFPRAGNFASRMKRWIKLRMNGDLQSPPNFAGAPQGLQVK